jgi:hypothetical protein
MRGSTIWFLLAAFWGLDSGLAVYRHNWLQVALTAVFACCFLIVGLIFRRKEQRGLKGKLR